MKLWDVATGRELKTLIGGVDPDSPNAILSILFSLDGRTLAQRSGKTIIKAWDVATGKESKAFPQDLANVASNDYEPFSNDRRFQVKRGPNGKLNLFEVKTSALLASLIVLDKKDWVVVTPDGRFDTNRLDDPQGLHWILPDAPFTPLSFEVFMRDYFEPKLLPRLINCTEARNCNREFKPVRNLSALNRTQPAIRISKITTTASATAVEVSVEVNSVSSEYQRGPQGKPLSSGAYDLRLFRNGQMVGHSTADERLKATLKNYETPNEELAAWRDANKLDLVNGKSTFTFLVRLPNHEQNIEFSAYAFNDDRVKSETARMTYTLPTNAMLNPEARKAYVITFGVNKYDNPEWDLQFAANDARATTEIFSTKLRQRKEFTEVIEVSLISDIETSNNHTIERRDATKGNIQVVFELLAGKTLSAQTLKQLEKAVGIGTLKKIHQATPTDMVLVSFSSHGYADKNGVFYVMPSDIGKDSGRTITDESLRNSISSDELSLWLRDVDAGELVMIVDACHAASAVQGRLKPAPMGSRGLGQLAFDKGMKILTATQAANVAIETGGTIGHGLLTFALVVEGLERNQADFRAADKTINLKRMAGVRRGPRAGFVRRRSDRKAEENRQRSRCDRSRRPAKTGKFITTAALFIRFRTQKIRDGPVSVAVIPNRDSLKNIQL